MFILFLKFRKLNKRSKSHCAVYSSSSIHFSKWKKSFCVVLTSINKELTKQDLEVHLIRTFNKIILKLQITIKITPTFQIKELSIYLNKKKINKIFIQQNSKNSLNKKKRNISACIFINSKKKSPEKNDVIGQASNYSAAPGWRGGDGRGPIDAWWFLG